MVKLIYSAIASLDGYVADADGRFDWSVPDDEVHAFVNDLERPVGTYLYGRRMYEVMAAWETMDAPADQPLLPRLREHLAGGRQGRLLADAGGGLDARTRLERDFDPAAVRRLKESAAQRHLGRRPGARRAVALAAGLVDECHLFLSAGRGRRRHACAARRPPRSTSSCSTSAASPTASSTCATRSSARSAAGAARHVEIRPVQTGLAPSRKPSRGLTPKTRNGGQTPTRLSHGRRADRAIRDGMCVFRHSSVRNKSLTLVRQFSAGNAGRPRRTRWSDSRAVERFGGHCFALAVTPRFRQPPRWVPCSSIGGDDLPQAMGGTT